MADVSKPKMALFLFANFVSGSSTLIISVMLLEAVNSVFLTFLATDYLLSDDSTTLQHLRVTTTSQHSQLQYAFAAVLAINILVNFHAARVALAEGVHDKLATLFRVPRIVVAIFSFITALYWDCRHKYGLNSKNRLGPAAATRWSKQYFFRQLLQSFCRLLPIYPFLAVVISFGFLFVISTFERLHLPLEILNMPIYYGTLYGYVRVRFVDLMFFEGASVFARKTVSICLLFLRPNQ
jgi:hypothetical protein